MTQQVERLEDSAGSCSSDQRRGLRLTPSGERLLVRARRLLAHLKRALPIDLRCTLS